MSGRPLPGAILDADPWFSALPPGCRGPLAAAARRRSLENRERAYRIGDPSDGLFHVEAGEIRLIARSRAGRRLVHLTVLAGGWFGALSTLDDGPRPHDAVAVGQAVLLHIPVHDIHNIAADAPQLYRSIALLTCRNQRTAIDHIGVMQVRSTQARLAHILMSMVENASGGTQVRMSQQELADRVGVTRQCLSRALRSVEEAGLIRTTYRRIDILEPAGLVALTWQSRPAAAP